MGFASAMSRVFGLLILACMALTDAAKTEDECSDAVEEKIGKLIETGKYGEGAAALAGILKEHDHDGDGHVTEPDIKKVIDTLGLGSECHSIAGKIISHLT